MVLSLDLLCSILPPVTQGEDGNPVTSPHIRYMLYYENSNQPKTTRRILTIRFDTRLTVRLSKERGLKKRARELLRAGISMMQRSDTIVPDDKIDIPVGTLLKKFEHEVARERNPQRKGFHPDYELHHQHDSHDTAGVFLRGKDKDAHGVIYEYFQMSLHCTNPGIPSIENRDFPFDQLLMRVSERATPQNICTVKKL